ncbi:hypothetical protein BGZ75_002226 [Mortierella antarctica]|nr:hypothetical protein BGZ75_002226 [Mortierella antarctica]
MDKDSFEAAMRIIRLALQDRINHTAQTALANGNSSRFNQLDLLSIGQDHVFVIHRELLLQDIYDFLSYSPKGLQRIPGNRYKPLEDYLREVLLPDIKQRIATWDEAERVSRPLEIPVTLSMVTLVGWLSSYPVNYVHPTRERLEKRKLEADDDDDDDQDCGRNCLANQLLVLTSVQLEPSETVNGLKDHLMMSFSYPAELAERFMDRSLLSPESPCSPCEPSNSCLSGTGTSGSSREGVGSQYQVDDDDDDDDGQEFVDASDAEFTEPEGDPEDDGCCSGASTQQGSATNSSTKHPSPLKLSDTTATAAVPLATVSSTSPTTTTGTICLPDYNNTVIANSISPAVATATSTTTEFIQIATFARTTSVPYLCPSREEEARRSRRISSKKPASTEF